MEAVGRELVGSDVVGSDVVAQLAGGDALRDWASSRDTCTCESPTRATIWVWSGRWIPQHTIINMFVRQPDGVIEGAA